MTEKMRIELSLLLPAVLDARDTCVTRLRDILRAKVGIEDAHLVERSDKGLAEICVHFDPRQLSISEVRDLAHRSGAELEQRYGHLLIN